MKGPPLGPGGEDITWPDQVAPRGLKACSTRKIKHQTSNIKQQQKPLGKTTQRGNPSPESTYLRTNLPPFCQVVIFCSSSSFNWDRSPIRLCFSGHELRVGLA